MVRFLLLLVWALMSTTGYADWRSVDAESRLEFVPRYDGAELPGEFRQFAVRLRLDPRALEQACLVVVVEVSSANMNDPELNEGIAGPQWFHFERFPRARFESNSIRAGNAAGAFIAEGELRLKGFVQPVSVPFQWSRSGQRAEMNGRLTLSRSDFSIGTGEWAEDDTIGEQVDVRFQVVLHEEP